MNIQYISKNIIQNPLKEIKNNEIVINLSSQYYIDQEAKKLKLAKKSFNDTMIDKQYKAFNKFLLQR